LSLIARINDLESSLLFGWIDAPRFVPMGLILWLFLCNLWLRLAAGIRFACLRIEEAFLGLSSIKLAAIWNGQ